MTSEPDIRRFKQALALAHYKCESRNRLGRMSVPGSIANYTAKERRNEGHEALPLRDLRSFVLRMHFKSPVNGYRKLG